jgi:hypothetical protein
VYKCTFNAQYKVLFSSKPKLIPTFCLRVEELLGGMGFDFSDVALFRFASQEPWTLELPNVQLTMHTGKKSENNPQLLRSQFYKFLGDKQDSVHIYTDGSKDNSGVAATAVSNGHLFLCHLLNKHPFSLLKHGQ